MSAWSVRHDSLDENTHYCLVPSGMLRFGLNVLVFDKPNSDDMMIDDVDRECRTPRLRWCDRCHLYARVFVTDTLHTPFSVVTPFLEIKETLAARPTLLDITARGSDMRPTASSTYSDKSSSTSDL